MQIFIRLSAVFFVFAALVGCSINPTVHGFVVDNENRNKIIFGQDITVPIIRQVRCETRDAMLMAAAKLLEQKPFIGYANTKEIVKNFRNDPETLTKINSWDVHPVAQVMASFFTSSTVKLDFDLQVEEQNKHVASINLNPSGGAHPTTLKITDHSSLAQRRSKSTINLPDASFDTLRKVNCTRPKSLNDIRSRAQFKDWLYPIRGNTNIASTINAFIDYAIIDSKFADRYLLAQTALFTSMHANNWENSDGSPISKKDFNALMGAKHFSNCATAEKPTDCRSRKIELRRILAEVVAKFAADAKSLITCKKENCTSVNLSKTSYRKIINGAGKAYNKGLYTFGYVIGNPPSMTAQRLFTTTLDGGINPSIGFSDAHGSFKVNMLGYTATNKRIDTHTLTITLQTKTKFEEKKKPEAIKLKLGATNGYELLLNLPLGTSIEDCPYKVCKKNSRAFTKNERQGGGLQGGHSIAPPISDEDAAEAISNTDGPFLSYEFTEEEKQMLLDTHNDAVEANRLERLIESIQD